MRSDPTNFELKLLEKFKKLTFAPLSMQYNVTQENQKSPNGLELHNKVTFSEGTVLANSPSLYPMGKPRTPFHHEQKSLLGWIKNSHLNAAKGMNSDLTHKLSDKEKNDQFYASQKAVLNVLNQIQSETMERDIFNSDYLNSTFSKIKITGTRNIKFLEISCNDQILFTVDTQSVVTKWSAVNKDICYEFKIESGQGQNPVNIIGFYLVDKGASAHHNCFLVVTKSQLMLYYEEE